MGAPGKTAPIRYHRLTGAMGGPPKTAPTRYHRLTGAMGAPPKNSPMGLIEALSPSSDTDTGLTFDPITFITFSTPTNSTTSISKLRSSPYVQSRKKGPTRPLCSLLLPHQDFSLSANGRMRPIPHDSLWHPLGKIGLKPLQHPNRKPKHCPRPTKQVKPRWMPRSAARRRLERLRSAASVAVIPPTTTDSFTGNIYKIERAISKDKNKYTYELIDNLKPHDFFFTPHFLTFDVFLYWEFKAG